MLWLTEHGQELLTEVAPALERIGTAVALVREAGETVRINARPSFALRWLIPHLPAFMAAHPEIRPEVITSTTEPAALPSLHQQVLADGERGCIPGQWRSWRTTTRRLAG